MSAIWVIAVILLIFIFFPKTNGISGQLTTTKKAGLCVTPSINPVYTRCDDMNDNSNNDSLANSAIGWYYSWSRYSKYADDPNNNNWGLNCNPLPTKEFVPMLWGINQNHINQGKIISTYIDTVDTTYLLGFNEPNRNKQSKLFPQRAAQFWKDYVIPLWGNTLTLVSPVPHNCYLSDKCLPGYDDANVWFDHFFGNFSGPNLTTQIANSQIEYIAVHAYSCNTDAVMIKLNDTYKRYGKKIWLTEFACGSNEGSKTQQDQNDYIDDIIEKLENADYIFRYSFYKSRGDSINDERGILEFDMNNPSELSETGDKYIWNIDTYSS